MNDYLSTLASKLQSVGVDSPHLEARMLVAHALGVKSLSEEFSELTPHQQALIEQIVEKRAAHFPLCKILGEKGFYKYDFMVNENVLSPRPDTEVLVEAAIIAAKRQGAKTILDLGTGSGCIILSILGDVETLTGFAVDASEKALEVAVANAQNMGLENRVRFFHASWFDEDLPERLGTSFDLIVSNPPYIPSTEILELESEVKEHDPLSALDGGEDGLHHYRQIAALSAKILNPGGLILLEGGLHQENAIADIFVSSGLQRQEVIADLSGINRCIILKK